MFEILIFGGTTEGRMLAEFCCENKIHAFVSVTTDYGAELLPESEYIKVLNGKLNRDEIIRLISENKFSTVIDATHPYAVLATENIRFACVEAGVKHYRLKRESDSEISGTVLNNPDELVEYLNSSNKQVLSTLGSKELYLLNGVNNCCERVWVRVLPVEGITELCESYGIDRDKIILGRGPFSVSENIEHIERSGAEILVTKESGIAGGYPEKVKAAARLGIELVTIKRPKETGYKIDEIKEIILRTAR